MCDCIDVSRVGPESEATSRIVSGRPLDGEFADYARADIDCVGGSDAVGALATQAMDTRAPLKPLHDSDVRGVTYAPGKWTVKEVIGHRVRR